MNILRVTHVAHREPFEFLLPKLKIKTPQKVLGVSGSQWSDLSLCMWKWSTKCEKQEIKAIFQSQHLCVLSALWGSAWQLLEQSLNMAALHKGHWERAIETRWLTAQVARVEVSRVGGDLRVQAMDAALHLSRHGPLLKLQLSRVHHRATQHRKQPLQTYNL